MITGVVNGTTLESLQLSPLLSSLKIRREQYSLMAYKFGQRFGSHHAEGSPALPDGSVFGLSNESIFELSQASSGF